MPGLVEKEENTLRSTTIAAIRHSPGCSEITHITPNFRACAENPTLVKPQAGSFDMCDTVTVDPFRLYFLLKSPCSKCPFRKGSLLELQPGRLEGIVSNLLANDKATFSCHNTLSYSDRDNSNFETESEDDVETPAAIDYLNGEKMCAGAAAYLMKVGRPSVGMRYAMHSGSISFDHWKKAEQSVIDLVDLKINY